MASGIRKSTRVKTPRSLNIDSEEEEGYEFWLSRKFGNTPRKSSIRSSEATSTNLHEQVKYKVESPIKNRTISSAKSPETPPKLRKLNDDKVIHNTPSRKNVRNNENLQLTPSTLLEKLSIETPTKGTPTNEGNTTKKPLFQNDLFQTARKALHSTSPAEMPGREKEIDELRDFITGHLDQKTSGSLYVSGPPGTGKTASLRLLLEQETDIVKQVEEVYVNCTAIKSSGSIYSRIMKELRLKSKGTTEKDCLNSIETYLTKKHKTILLVLDEIDQLESKKQSVLYTIFEWPSRPESKLILIGIANALDLTDRILPRLQARCELKPRLMHFAPYSKPQIVEILISRLKQANVLDTFSSVSLQFLAGKVAAVSGDVRRALDIGRRAIELNDKDGVLKSIDNLNSAEKNDTKTVDLKQVINVLDTVYGTSQTLNEEDDDAFPMQQKIVICSLLLLLKKAANKDVTIGKLHDVYKKVCVKRNLFSVDQSEFVGLCSLIETKGIIKVIKKNEPRLHKVSLEWNEEEVAGALNDRALMSTILQDRTCVGKH